MPMTPSPFSNASYFQEAFDLDSGMTFFHLFSRTRSIFFYLAMRPTRMWNRGHSSDAVAMIFPAVVGLCEETSHRSLGY